jgi:hypothetical protein
MIKLTLPAVLAFLKRTYQAELQEEKQQIVFMLKIDDKEIPVFANVLHETILQMIAYLPYELKPDGLGEIARFLHLINKQLDVPGFGLDENVNMVFYRFVIPSLNPEIEDKLVEAHLSTISVACRSFMSSIEALVNGNVSSIDQALRASQLGKQVLH